MKITISTEESLAHDTGRLPEESPLREKVIHALRGVLDPELPVNIYDLGLIYSLEISEDNAVHIRMTLTAPTCPVAEELPKQAQQAVQNVPEVSTCTVTLTWEPKWDKSMMSEAARLDLGLF